MFYCNNFKNLSLHCIFYHIVYFFKTLIVLRYKMEIETMTNDTLPHHYNYDRYLWNFKIQDSSLKHFLILLLEWVTACVSTCKNASAWLVFSTKASFTDDVIRDHCFISSLTICPNAKDTDYSARTPIMIALQILASQTCPFTGHY